MTVSGGATKTARFFEKIESKLLAGNDLSARLKQPIEFIPKASGRTAYGYEAELLADVSISGKSQEFATLVDS